MATAVLRAAFLLPKSPHIAGVLAAVVKHHCVRTPLQLSVVTTQLVSIRNVSFFNKKSGEEMWDSVTSVSNQGRMRGRASRGKLKKRVNFYRGNRIGDGEAGMKFPGLNAPIVDGEKLTKLFKPAKKVEDFDKNRDEKMALLYKGSSRRFKSAHPLDRGYTSQTACGTSVGPPTPVNGYSFDGFDTRILEKKFVANMTATLGVQRTQWILVMTGNHNGLVGLSVGKGQLPRAATASAKSKASQRLVYVERYQDRTVYHNFTETYHRTRVIVTKMHKGYGLRCHRVIKTICELIGITDIHVKAEGRTKNTLALTRAFLTGLLNQTTFQDFANQTGHHVVEYNKNRDFYPLVVASPAENSTTDFVRDENFDFDTYFYGGKLPLRRDKPLPFYHRDQSWRKKSRVLAWEKQQYTARIQRITHGLEPAYNSKQARKDED